MDQQTKNRRIHELMGRCLHEGNIKKFVIPYKDRIQCVGYKDGDVYLHRCECGSTASSGRWDFPDYYNDPIAAREALAFAVEQKGAIKVGLALIPVLTVKGLDESLADTIRKGSHDEWEKGFDTLIAATASAAALAPASVLCETALAVLEEK